MPRKRPGAVRATRHLDGHRIPEWAYACGPIDRLSPDTSAAIHIAERCGFGEHVKPLKTASFLHNYREFLSQRGQRLRLLASECPGCPGCQYLDIAVVRDGLAAVLDALPPRAQAELRRLIRRLDTDYLRRTLPESIAEYWTAWNGELLPWWHRRIYENR